MMKRRGLIIDGYSTAIDGKMTMTSLSADNPPYRENFMEVPGLDGSLDLCETPDGIPHYADRQLVATFECSEGTAAERQRRFDEMSARIHGRRCSIILPDDPEYSLSGRINLSVEFNRPTYSQLSITAVCEPWKTAVTASAVQCTVLPATENRMRFAALERMEDLQTCEITNTIGEAVGLISGSTCVLTTWGGDVHARGCWRLRAEPDTSYYISASLYGGPGFWRATTTPEVDIAEKQPPTVRTGADGFLYFWIYRLAKNRSVTGIRDILVVPAANVSILHAGQAPTQLFIKDWTSPQYEVLSINGCSFSFRNASQYAERISAGSFPVCAFSYDSPANAYSPISLLWHRRKL